jgi:hypothetical protein
MLDVQDPRRQPLSWIPCDAFGVVREPTTRPSAYVGSVSGVPGSRLSVRLRHSGFEFGGPHHRNAVDGVPDLGEAVERPSPACVPKLSP